MKRVKAYAVLNGKGGIENVCQLRRIALDHRNAYNNHSCGVKRYCRVVICFISFEPPTHK